MIRSDKEVTDPQEPENIISSPAVCRIGLCDGDQPYVVPVCFGYEAGMILHSFVSRWKEDGDYQGKPRGGYRGRFRFRTHAGRIPL